MFCISGNAMLPILRRLRINYLTHHPTGTFHYQTLTFNHIWFWQKVHWRKCMDLSKCNRAKLRILYGQGNKIIIKAIAFLSKYAIARRESIQFQCISKKSLNNRLKVSIFCQKAVWTLWGCFEDKFTKLQYPLSKTKFFEKKIQNKMNFYKVKFYSVKVRDR